VQRGIVLRQSVVELLKITDELGIKKWIVTSSPELVVKAAMEYFNIQTNLIGVSNILKNGLLTQELKTPIPIREDKVTAIKEYIDPKETPIMAVGDSMNDLWMLEYAQLKVVVKKNEKLVSLAQGRGWEVL